MEQFPIKEVHWAVAPREDGVFKQRMYTFEDAEGPKAQYMAKLAGNLEFLRALFVFMQSEVALWDQIQNIVPADLGGKSEWTQEMTVVPIPSLGATYVNAKNSLMTRGFYVFHTALTKEAYFAENPPSLEYMRELIKIYSTNWSDRSLRVIEQILPADLGGTIEWMRDFTEENTAAFAAYTAKREEA